MVWYLDQENRYAGGIGLFFAPTSMKYALQNCMQYFIPFPTSTSVPTEQKKIWTIEKDGLRTAVFCNGKMVLDVTVSSAICDDSNFAWRENWERKVSKVRFPSQHDTATDFYSIG